MGVICLVLQSKEGHNRGGAVNTICLQKVIKTHKRLFLGTRKEASLAPKGVIESLELSDLSSFDSVKCSAISAAIVLRDEPAAVTKDSQHYVPHDGFNFPINGVCPIMAMGKMEELNVLPVNDFNSVHIITIVLVTTKITKNGQETFNVIKIKMIVVPKTSRRKHTTLTFTGDLSTAHLQDRWWPNVTPRVP